MNQNPLHFSQKAYLNYTRTHTHHRIFSPSRRMGVLATCVGGCEKPACFSNPQHTHILVLYVFMATSLLRRRSSIWAL